MGQRRERGPSVSGDVICADRICRRPIVAACDVNLPIPIRSGMVRQPVAFGYRRAGTPRVRGDVVDPGRVSLETKAKSGDVIDLAPAWRAGRRSGRCRCRRWCRAWPTTAAWSQIVEHWLLVVGVDNHDVRSPWQTRL